MYRPSEKKFIREAVAELDEALKKEGIIVLDIETKPTFQMALKNIGELYYQHVKEPDF